MADNVSITAGSGTSIAADDISSVLHQRVKISVGADGSATDMVGGAGVVSSATPRVTLGSDDPAVTALQIIDDWDETDRAKVNVIAGQAGIAAGTGVDGATVPRVTLATNVGLPAGTSNIGDIDVVGGTVADDGTTPGNPVMIGGKAVETDGTDPTSVSAEDDVAIVRTDRNRRLLVNKAHPNLWKANENNATAQTNNAIKAAPGASLSLYVTDIVISNGATAGTVKIVEDTAGTPVDIIGPLYLAINGGAAMHFETPLRITANKDIGYTSVTVTTHTVMVAGYTAP